MAPYALLVGTLRNRHNLYTLVEVSVLAFAALVAAHPPRAVDYSGLMAPLLMLNMLNSAAICIQPSNSSNIEPKRAHRAESGL